MDAFDVLENSYIAINKNFSFYKKNFGHLYYLSVRDDETVFIDKLFKSTDNVLSAQDKMLSYSVSTIYTATAVLIELMDRYGIQYSSEQIESLCKGFTAMKKEEIRFTDKTDSDLEEILFGLLTDKIDLESRKKSGSERTPGEIIEYMLDLINYKGNNIIGKCIVDPACGSGTFIAQITDRFADAVSNVEISKKIVDMLIYDKVIRAYDTKPSNTYVTKIVLVEVLIRKGIISEIEDILKLMKNLPVYCEDFLKIEEKTDFIVGNPPYIRLQNLSNEYRDFIKNNFLSATGRFDIYTCFIENADKLLNENGKMCLITSNKYLTANYGKGIRCYLSESRHVRKIVDLFDTKFFGAAVLPAIIVCENVDNHSKEIEYIGIKSTSLIGQISCRNIRELFNYVENVMSGNKSVISFGIEDSVSFELVHSVVAIPMRGKTWNFSSDKENDIKAKLEKNRYCTLGDIFDVCVGIKTTADSVFVKPMTENFIKERAFEKDVIYPLIQSFNVEKWNISWGKSSKDRYILYPHKEVEGTMIAVPLENIPNTRKYLVEHEDILKKRTYLTELKTREWYECWVPQKLSKFQQPKIITRDIVSYNSFAYDNSGKLCQGNTFFLTRKPSVFTIEYSSMSEEEYYLFVLGMLNSKVMEYYQKMISGCLYSQKYRYTSTNLNRWPIPKISVEHAMLISMLVESLLNGNERQDNAEMNINEIMYEQFELTKEEIAKVEEFVQLNA